MTWYGNAGTPRFTAVIVVSRRNGSVMIATDGAPASEQRTASCKLHELHDPQSPMPLTMTCARASISARSPSEIALPALGF